MRIDLPFDRFQESVEFVVLYCHRMLGCRIGTIVHICLEFFEGGDALVLQTLQFRAEVAVNLAVAWLVVLAIAADIFGEEVLRIGILAAPMPSIISEEFSDRNLPRRSGTTSNSAAKQPICSSIWVCFQSVAASSAVFPTARQPVQVM